MLYSVEEYGKTNYIFAWFEYIVGIKNILHHIIYNDIFRFHERLISFSTAFTVTTAAYC